MGNLHEYKAQRRHIQRTAANILPFPAVVADCSPLLQFYLFDISLKILDRDTNHQERWDLESKYWKYWKYLCFSLCSDGGGHPDTRTGFVLSRQAGSYQTSDCFKELTEIRILFYTQSQVMSRSLPPRPISPSPPSPTPNTSVSSSTNMMFIVIFVYLKNSEPKC